MGETLIGIVEDDAPLRRSVARLVKRCGARPRAFATIGDAHLFPSHRVDGWIVDIYLPDGNGLEMLQRLRAGGCSEPALVVTGFPSDAAARQASRLRAPLHSKPVDAEAIRALVAEANAKRDSTGPCATDLFDRRVATYLVKGIGLTDAEADILLARMEGMELAGICEKRDVTINTIKTQVKHILRKAGARGYANESIDRLLLCVCRQLLDTCVDGAPGGGDGQATSRP